MNKSFIKPLTGLFIACIVSMLWSYSSGFENAIDWGVTTTAEVIEFPAWTLETDLMTHEIKGEKYLLSERYTGSEIKRNIVQDYAFTGIIWLGICIVLVTSTYLKRYPFFITVALFALFINRLNLFEIGLFGVQSKLITLLPAILFIVPLVIFHEYKKTTPFLVRISSLVSLSVILLLGINDGTQFIDHFIANSLFGISICALIFLFIIGEEIVYSILHVVTSGKGGKSNHLHFLILSVIYLGNLVLYYLNKSGLFENSFFLFDPFILLAISCLVSLWSLKFKREFLARYLDIPTLYSLFLGFGVIALTFLTHQMIRGNDAVYQAFHYFILYFHIGFGTLFFLYIIGNFIDPLIKGLEIHKIVYKERNFPYASARLGGFFAVLAFYFLAGQEPYNLLKSGYYNYLSKEALTENNHLLAKEYALQASYLGYNTHYANYWLGWNEKKRDAEYPAKTYFLSASQRFPSPYALVNYGNLDSEFNANKVQAIYEEKLRKKSSGEIENNLGLLHLAKGAFDRALNYFENAQPLDRWNYAPQVNKWNTFKRMELIDSSKIESDYVEGNFGVKANILTTQVINHNLSFEYKDIERAGYLHRQSYLLNSSYLFSHDSVESLIRHEISQSTDGTSNDRLRKALAIHLYNKGEVNKAFMMFDYLQAHAHQYYKGEYLDAMGKLALDQGAYRLAKDFFDQAIELRSTKSLFSSLEVLARMGKEEEIPNELLRALKRNPELTETSNQFLEKLKRFESNPPASRSMPQMENLPDSALIAIGGSNAFHTTQVVAVVEELNQREASGGYELLVDAMEINPYSTVLLKEYSLAALNWNLIEYADQSLAKLKELLTESEFNAFAKSYDARKKEINEAEW